MSHHGYATETALVDAAWAQEHLADPNVRFVEVDVDTTAYEQSHLPGRRRLGLDEPAVRRRPPRHRLARGLQRAAVGVGHRPGHDHRPVRRQQQLVRRVGVLAAQAVRPRRRPHPRRRAQVLAGPGPAAVASTCRPTTTTGYQLPEPDFALRAFRDDILPRLGDPEPGPRRRPLAGRVQRRDHRASRA